MIKLHTKKKHALNYYLFETKDVNDADLISINFSYELNAEPLFLSRGVIRDKAYVLIGTCEALERKDFTDFQPKKIFPSSSMTTNSNSLEFFYLCNFKENVIDDFLIPLFNQLIKWDVESTIITSIPAENPVINMFRSSRSDVNDKIKILVPYFISNVFSDCFDSPVFTTNSEEIPVIIIKTINKDCAHQINTNSFLIVKKHIEKKPLGRVINYSEKNNQIFFSVENNESAWNVINGLKYSKYHEEFLQITHFLDLALLESMKQWNILVTGIPSSKTYVDIFEEYGKIEGESGNHKRIINIEIYKEDEEHNNANIQFLKVEDADELWKKDPKKIKINYLSMIMQNFQEEEGVASKETIKSWFPKSSFVIEKANNSNRTRSILQVFFDSKDDLTDALSVSGMISRKPKIPSDLLQRTSNKEYQYKISTEINSGLFSNYLRVFCFAYRPNSENNKLMLSLNKQLWWKNTILIYSVGSAVGLDDVVEAFEEKEFYIQSISFFRNNVIVSLQKKKDFNWILNNGCITIAEKEYQVDIYRCK